MLETYQCDEWHIQFPHSVLTIMTLSFTHEEKHSQNDGQSSGGMAMDNKVISYPHMWVVEAPLPRWCSVMQRSRTVSPPTTLGDRPRFCNVVRQQDVCLLLSILFRYWPPKNCFATFSPPPPIFDILTKYVNSNGSPRPVVKVTVNKSTILVGINRSKKRTKKVPTKTRSPSSQSFPDSRSTYNSGRDQQVKETYKEGSNKYAYSFFTILSRQSINLQFW